jgi:hypothetical protein
LVDQIKDDEMARACSTDGINEKCIQYFGWETLREETLGRPRRRWEGNIRMDFREIG